MDGEDTGTVGHLPTGLGDVLQGGGAGGYSIRVRDVGDYPPYRLGPGGVPSQGHATDYGESTTAASGWELRPPSAVYGDAGSGILRYGGVFSKDSEYCCNILQRNRFCTSTRIRCGCQGNG